MADPILYMPNTIGEIFACVFKATQYEGIVVAPLTMPAAPMPEIALPNITAIEFGATAETTDPSSKMMREMQYIHLML